MGTTGHRISFKAAVREPFRFFFPQAVLAGIVGVTLWPLYFWHVTEFYPNLSHVRVMAYGFFGGFIFGFLGTALPRMLSAKPLTARSGRAHSTITAPCMNGCGSQW